MLSHDTIWSAIDTLAQRHQLTPSGLARRAGLDPTSFNKSKRLGPDGRLRWPSTESIAKVLEATGATIDQFMSYLPAVAGRSSIPDGNFPPQSGSIPLLGFAQAGAGGFFDDGGFPAGQGWDVVEFPVDPSRKAGVYALEVQGESMMPLYRDGDVVVVSPAAPVRRGDRVIVKTRDGEVLAKELKRRTAKTVELRSLNPEHEDRVLQDGEIAFVARVLWASQ